MGTPPTNGFDKRPAAINRKGRPKTFDAARELAQAIAHERARVGGEDVIIDGHAATVIEMILRQWATSKVPALQQAFIEYAIGKPPLRTEISGPGGKPIETKQVHDVDPEFYANVFVVLGAVNATPGTQDADQPTQTAGA